MSKATTKLLAEVNKDGIKVRIDIDSFEGNVMYEVSVYIDGVQQTDMWKDYDDVSMAMKYADACFMELLEEFAV